MSGLIARRTDFPWLADQGRWIGALLGDELLRASAEGFCCVQIPVRINRELVHAPEGAWE